MHTFTLIFRHLVSFPHSPILAAIWLILWGFILLFVAGVAITLGNLIQDWAYDQGSK